MSNSTISDNPPEDASVDGAILQEEKDIVQGKLLAIRSRVEQIEANAPGLTDLKLLGKEKAERDSLLDMEEALQEELLSLNRIKPGAHNQ
jgi:hypothetical protein